MASLSGEQLEEALGALGDLLAARSQHYELVLIGGGNLILRGVTTRTTTKDLDVLGEWTGSAVRPLRPMPEALLVAIRDVATAYGLAANWMNLGPESLIDLGLPGGFEQRLTRADYRGLGVWFAGRFDMICFKLYAAVDQGPRSYHFADLQELQPAANELTEAARWTTTHDPSIGFRSMLLALLTQLGIDDADSAI